ncbi:glycoside hydrolase family 2 TIM barrel-domain containing protein [Arachidicoccus ginsenosidivorans]
MQKLKSIYIMSLTNKIKAVKYYPLNKMQRLQMRMGILHHHWPKISSSLFLKTASLSLFLILLIQTTRAQIKPIALQSFNSGWQYTTMRFQDKKDAQAAKPRGLGSKWDDQFNIQSVDIKYKDTSKSATIKNKEQLSVIKTQLEHADWHPVTLPHSAFIEPVPIEKPIEGYAFYKKTFKVPSNLKGKLIQLQFDGAMQIAEIWVNGQFVKRHLGGYLPFSVNLTDILNFGKENTIFVKLDNRANPILPPGKPVEKLDFIYYSGIYRDTWLKITDPLHITSANEIQKPGGGGVFAHYLGLAPRGHGGILKITTHIKNQDNKTRTFRLEQSLSRPRLNGQTFARSYLRANPTTPPCSLLPGQDTTIIQTLLVTNPRQWSPDKPYLYTLTSTVKENGKLISGQNTNIGLRTLRITAEKGVLINGNPIHINGSNRHMNYPWIGNALSDNANIRDAILVKKAGINALRLAHYPQDPSFYDACDSLGILLIDCIPGWQFFNKAETFQELVMRDIRQMIYRDRNHPAIFLWETSLNESYPPAAFRIKQAQVAHKAWQDSTDFYTSGDSYFTKAAWDVPYDDWNGDPGNRNNTTYPANPFLIREYGDYEFGGGQSTSRKSRGDGQQAMLQQAWNLQWEHNRNQLRYPRCIGDMTWAFFDGLAGVTNKVESWGLADLYRIPKFSYYFFQSQQKTDSTMVYIADYWAKTKSRDQTDNPQKTRKVIIYSNGDSVQLSINGKAIATRKPDSGADRPYGTDLEKGGHPFTGGDAADLSAPPFTFDAVPFTPGSLKAVAYAKGKIAATQTIYTPGTPTGLKLSLDDQGVPLKADGADAVFVRATLIDSAGHPVYTNTADLDKTIHFSISGPAVIVSPNERQTEAGIASILIQATTQKGKLVIKASATGLKSATLTYNLQ